MRSQETVLFEKCPLCRRGKISTYRTGFPPFAKTEVCPCPKCSAEFVAKDVEGYQLVFCEPHRLVGKHNCGERIFRGCYLDATLSREEWQKIAEGGQFPSLSKFLETSAKLSKGILPAFPSGGLPFTLEKGETLHYVSSPVFQGDRQRSLGETADKGCLYITSKRMVFIYFLGTVAIPFENIEQVEDSRLGFLIREQGVFEPRYFYPLRYDPVLAALQGAIRNFKSKS